MHNVPWKLDLIQLGYQIMEVDSLKTRLLHLMFFLRFGMQLEMMLRLFLMVVCVVV